jgi:hypothetical protein
MFSFEYFKLLLIKAYHDVGDSINMSYDDVEYIFNYYFNTFKKTFGKPHKNIKLATIKSIIEKLEYCEHSGRQGFFELDVETYEILIDRYFRTQYTDCDYSISHFMSGDIRANRFYETSY